MWRSLCSLLAIYGCLALTLGAQESQTRIETSTPNLNWSALPPLSAPREISASDGIYDKFILIRWEASEQAAQYKVFRSTSAKASALQEVSNAWQKSTWLCDYTAIPNVDYYYTVVASDGKNTSKMGTLDKGYLRKAGAIALEPGDLAMDNEVYGAQRQIFLLIAGVNTLSKSFRPAETIEVNSQIQNIFEQATPLTELRYFISEDTVLDWNDQLLKTKTLSSIPANAKLEMKESLALPINLLPGTYYLIVVSSTEGQILSSKTAIHTIKIGN